MSLVVVMLAETVGLWFVNNRMNAAADRMVTANWIYQFSVFPFVLEMISIPYGASVISHEKMGTFAFVTVSKVILMFCVALLLAVSPIDKLIFYGLLVFAIELCIQMMCWISPKLQSNIHWKTITIQNHRFVQLGAIKFYRRYTLENLMNILVDEQFEGSINSQ